jgi:hypothetical protein
MSRRIKFGHHIQFNEISILAKKLGWIIRNVTTTELHPENMNREEGFSLNTS